MADSCSYRARWIVPVSAAPLENGTITIQGDTIASVDPMGVRTPDVDLGNVAIIPGLVNGHTHLDLSGARGRIPPTDPERFTDWIRGVIAFRRERAPEQVQADIQLGLEECLRSGTTLLGDIAVGGASWNVLALAPLRSVVFYELIGVRAERVEVARREAAAWMAQAETSHLRRGLSPHAPYSVHRQLVLDAGRLCQVDRRPLAIHLGESPGEIELLERRQGLFREFLEALGIWEPEALVADFQSIMTMCDFQQPKLFVHMNYVAPSARIPRDSTVVYCPRTHAAFGHPRHPFHAFQNYGVRVALGTDSLASNPDLDIFAEARFVHTNCPEVSRSELLRMITLSGAEALGWADVTGSLDVGKSADLVTVPLANHESKDVYELLFDPESPMTNRRTMFRGRWRDS